MNYPFEDYGYTYHSLQTRLYGCFLDYKIERPVFDFDGVDEEINILSISDTYTPLEKCAVFIEPKKYQYLLENKLGKLEQAQLSGLTLESLAEIIQKKIKQNYIYNLEFLEEYNVMKFNTVIEFTRTDGGYPARLLASFEYIPTEKKIRLLTFY